MSVVTPRAIASYPTLVTPEQATDDNGNPTGKPKYSLSLIFTDDTDIKNLRKAAMQVAVDKFGKDEAKKMLKDGSIRFEGGPHHTFRTDVASKGYPEGSTFISARTIRKPQVIDAAKNELNDAQVESLVYPGSVVRASVQPYWSDNPKNKGVYWALNNVQYLGEAGSAVDPRGPEGERLDGVVAATEEFEVDEEAMADLADLTSDAEEASADADDADDEDDVEDISDLLGD